MMSFHLTNVNTNLKIPKENSETVNRRGQTLEKGQTHLQKNPEKTKVRTTRTPLKSQVNAGSPVGQAVPAHHVHLSFVDYLDRINPK
jgi:hypothetical protein